jgi:hypothetical protein
MTDARYTDPRAQSERVAPPSSSINGLYFRKHNLCQLGRCSSEQCECKTSNEARHGRERAWNPWKRGFPSRVKLTSGSALIALRA